MKAPRSLVPAFAALSAGMILLSSKIIASHSAPLSGCVNSYLGDGYCDPANNDENCGFDGGDCCECTCVSTTQFSCDSTEFRCVDPSASCVNDDDVAAGPGAESSTFSCIPAYLGNGYCNEISNREECGYDGGDCCQCTCESTPEHDCDDNSFQCVDPRAPCVDDDDVTAVKTERFFTSNSGTFTPLGCLTAYFNDGICDSFNNNEACGYDGGDCCQCTCVSDWAYGCDVESFECVDPSASCVDDDDVTLIPATSMFTPFTSLGCVPSYFRDGLCDMVNNNEQCGYDGGDCCPCTCVSTTEFDCGMAGFCCDDPSAACVDDDSTLVHGDDTTADGSYSFSECITSFIGDGDCDADNNNRECDYDGGDCCERTCVGTFFYPCGVNGYKCADPAASGSGGLVDAGTFTTIVTTASAFDERPGAEGNDIGCGEDGCAPSLARDGDVSDAESRWSCARKIVPENDQCSLYFSFASPQNIKALEVAFWKNDQRERTLEVTINGERIGELPSDSESTFTSLAIDFDEVETVTLGSIGLGKNDWISLLEVRFLVDA